MKKAFIVLLILVIGIMSFADITASDKNKYQTTSAAYTVGSENAVLHGAVFVSIAQWIDVGLVTPDYGILLSYYKSTDTNVRANGQWNGEISNDPANVNANKGEMIGTITIGSNQNLILDVVLDTSSNSIITNSITALNLVKSVKDLSNSVFTKSESSSAKSISGTLAGDFANEYTVYDLRAAFQINKDTKALDADKANLSYQVTFKPTVSIPLPSLGQK